MKIFAASALALLVCLNCEAQQLVSKKFFSGKNADKEVDSSSKATRVETVVRNTDGSLTRTWTALPSGVVLLSTSLKGEEPVGQWVFRDKRGKVTDSFDYDFLLSWGSDTCTGYPLATRRIPTDGTTTVPDPLQLADGRQLGNFLADVLRYPDEAREAGLEGRVVINAVLTEEGLLENMVVSHAVHRSLDKEAARVLRMARFAKPRTADGKPTRLCANIPIKFVLE